MSSNLTVAHIVAGLHPKAGGPSRTVVQLCDAIANTKCVEVKLLSQRFSSDPTVESANVNVDRRIFDCTSRYEMQSGLLLKNGLSRLASQKPLSIIHSHGLWKPVNHWAAHIARQYAKELIIHPRGMLEPWALNHKAWKKKVAMKLFQRRDLETSRVLVATSIAEYQTIRSLGFRQPIAILPNGISVCLPKNTESRTEARRAVQNVLFLSRIHPVKGLVNLLNAWAQIMPVNWKLRICGPDEGGHLNELMEIVRKNGIGDSVEYLGEVDDHRKSTIYRDADVFVLPTYTENFGLVVAEALAHGLPVITTKGAPWADIEAFRCGWWIDIGVTPLISALKSAMALTTAERQAMGMRGSEYVRRYDWNKIAVKTIELYRWVLGDSAKPEFVQTD